MGLLTLEHGKIAYRADFALYGAAVLALAAFLAMEGPPEQRIGIATLAGVGLLSWSGIEYALHRFILHGVQPFRRWHAEHHQRPTALVAAPTILSATLIFTLIFLPAFLLTGVWHAAALTLGVLTGYLAYGITHHAIHHWRANHAWLKRRKLWHALHHHHVDQPGFYGVTSAFWDQLFGSSRPTAVPEDDKAWTPLTPRCPL
jgi:sterol desaturase/sphingolipid hydroxylase (fatty acid hydroxylase superfamily)